MTIKRLLKGVKEMMNSVRGFLNFFWNLIEIFEVLTAIYLGIRNISPDSVTKPARPGGSVASDRTYGAEDCGLPSEAKICEHEHVARMSERLYVSPKYVYLCFN